MITGCLLFIRNYFTPLSIRQDMTAFEDRRTHFFICELAWTYGHVSQKCYESPNDHGFRCQCSGVRKVQGTACYEPIGRELRADGLARVENRKQMIEEKGLTVFFHLTSVIFYLTPDTRHLKPDRIVFCKLRAGRNTGV
jgi:hypothetical protein